MKLALRLCIGLAVAALFYASVRFFRLAPDPVFEGRAASQWVNDLLSDDYSVRSEAQLALKILGEPAVPQLRVLLRKKNGPWEKHLARLNGLVPHLKYQRRDAAQCRLRASEMAAMLGPKARAAAPDLINALAFNEGETERALLRIGPASIPQLCGALEHRNPVVRERAARLLGSFDRISPETVGALLGRANDNHTPVRTAVAASLGKTSDVDERLKSALLRLAGDPNESVRAAAIKSLGRAGAATPEVISKLRTCLIDRSVLVQLEAAKALWKLDRDAAAVVPVLTNVLRTPEGWQAAYALAEMGSSAADAVPDLMRVLRQERVPRPFRTPPSSAFALGKIGAAAIAELSLALRDSDARVRMSALMAFGFMGPEGRSAVPEVLELLDDRDLEVRHAAAITLASLGAEPAQMIAGLSECLQAEDIYMRSAAAAVLRQIAPEGNWVVQPE